VNKTESLYKIFLQNRLVTTDSRNVPKNSVFFALKGDHFDGNEFAVQALGNGAAIAVVDDPQLKDNHRIFFVDDVLTSLQDLAMHHRSKLKATVIGITGTNGKTTTKELANAVLKQKYSCMATKGNLNNHIGVPLTLLSLPESFDYAIVEMGANHIGEIASLSRIANPAFGLITNVGKAHLEGFGSFNGVITAKTELFNYLRINGGSVFVNARYDVLVNAANNLESIFYGKTGNDVYGEITQSNPYLKVKCLAGSMEFELSTNLVGAYNLENVLAAVSIGHYFGVDKAAIKSAIENYIPENNRSQIFETNNNTLILDAYNANPSSMEAAISNFAEGGYAKKTLVLGEMLELGAESEHEHAKIIDLITGQRFDRIFLVGKSFCNFSRQGTETFESTDALMNYFNRNPLEGHTILIKGSRGNKLEQIVALL